jgi:hypothetical protein
MAHRSFPRLLVDTQFALKTSQAGLAKIARCSRRTVLRWQHGRGTPHRDAVVALLYAVHPVNPALAAELAAASGTTLGAAGIVEALPPVTLPPPPPAPPPPPPLLPARPAAVHLVDSVVCAAADAVGMLPHAVRPILLAAFERAAAVELSSAEVVAALRGEPPKKTAGKPAPSRR